MAEINFNKVKINVNLTEAASRQDLNSGDSVNTLFGKIKKWLSDLKTVAFSGSYNDLSDKPASLPANGGNADTVDGYHVDENILASEGPPWSPQVYYNDFARINPDTKTIESWNTKNLKVAFADKATSAGNATTVNNHTVNSDVPADAEFTDTVYDDTEIDNRVTNNTDNISQLFDITKGGEAVNGNSSYTLENTVDYPIMGINVYGKSIQNGTPTPENPVDIISVGDSGGIELNTYGGKNLFDPNKVYKSNYYQAADGNYFIDEKFNVYSIEVKENTEYNLIFNTNNQGNHRVHAVDNNDNWISQLGYVNVVALGEYMIKFTAATNKIHISIANSSTDVQLVESNTASIETALPLCGIPVSSGGNYTDSNGQQWVCDELIYNADGTGKIIKRTQKIIFDGSDDEGWATSQTQTSGKYRIITKSIKSNVFKPQDAANMPRVICDNYSANSATNTYFNINGISIDTAGSLIIYDDERSALSAAEWKSSFAANPITVVYQFAEPQEIQLTAAEMTALRQLQTFNGTTSISNNSGAEMSVKYCTNKALSEFVYPVTMGLQKQIDELRAAILSMGGNV